MRLALITPVHARHDHLRRQQDSIARSSRRPDLRVVVAMDDPDVAGLLPDDARVVTVDRGAYGLPLARARNLGAAAALAAGAELLVFLDVDCLLTPDALARYEEAARRPELRDALLTGAVRYLPEPGPDGYDLDDLPAGTVHAARPRPAAGAVDRTAAATLFWSLSFALRPQTWVGIGGFDEAYEGYGAEDTDFGLRAERAGAALVFVGGAETAHQWHPVSSPPTEHLDDLLRNAQLFAHRWGWWPMSGWFEQLDALGLVTRDHDGGWRRTVAAR